MTAFCVHCGRPPAEGDHGRCARLRAAVDPPRYCPDCARRMVVQVTPSGWSARCSRHGERSSRTDAHPTGSSPSSFNPVSPTD